MQPPTSERQRRSRLFLAAFLVLVVALSVLAGVLITGGLEDEERQEFFEELREEAGQ